MSVVVENRTMDQLIAEPNFAALLDEYADELALEGLPHPRAKLDMYKQLEVLGKIHPLAAYADGYLVGFVNVLMSENPHYGLCIAMTESFFVARDHRKTGAGVVLRREAELCAGRLGSPGLFISAPSGSNLALWLEGTKDYTETGRTYFKRLENA